MNLSQIERKFQCVDFMANYVNYKYNPHISKIKDLKQHAYKEELYADAKKEQAMYGLAAFQEGDPQEIIQGTTKMSNIGGRGSQKATSGKQQQKAANSRSGGASSQNLTRANTSHRGTSVKSGRTGIKVGRSTIITDGGSYAGGGHSRQQVASRAMTIADDGHT